MMVQEKVTRSFVSFIFMLFLSFTVIADDTVMQSFDLQRPKEVSDQVWNSLKTAVQEAKLLPTPEGIGGENSNYGKSVSVDGNRALVGAPYTAAHGVVYVLDFVGGNWIETAILQPDDGAADGLFGISVSLSGDRALIGASSDDVNGANSGAVYIFDLIGGSWSQTQKISADDGASGDYFGLSVSLSGDRALVGAHLDDDNGAVLGSAYIFDLVGGNWSQTHKLSADDGATNDHFGFSVSLSGDRALIGAYGDDDNGSSSGSAYLFDLSGGNWVQTQKLNAADGAAYDNFGYSVSLSGDRALIGAYLDDDNGSSSGSAYLFDLSGGSWLQTQKLSAADGASYDYFGYSVSLSGDRVLIGAYLDDDNGSSSGSAYIFDLSGGNWSQTQKISALDGATGEFFGYSVSLSGDRSFVGAYLDDENGSASGSIYIFDLSGGSWSQSQKLYAADGAAGDHFGVSVSLSGDRALIGAYWDDDNGSKTGSAYIFDLSGGSWSQTQKLSASDGAAGDSFGNSVSLLGDRALIGALGDDDNGSNSGSAFIFDFSAGSWLQTQKIIAADGAADDYFGLSVSLSVDRALIGAYRDDDNGTDSGSAYIFDLSGGNWSQTQKLSADDGAATDNFGHSVSLSGDRALIGAYGDDDNGSNSGSAYIFDFSGGSWSQTQKLTAADGAVFDRFGCSVSLSGDRALIGAYGDGDTGSFSGSAYIFDLSGGSWSQTQKLIAIDGAADDNFGLYVSLSGHRALIGAFRDDDNGSDSGSAYIFDLSGGSWSQTQKLIAIDGVAGDSFGSSVSLSGDRVLIGAYLDDDRGSNSGSVYVINTATTFNITVTVSGLDASNSIELTTNGQSLNFTGPGGPTNFANPINDGTAYDVNLTAQPTSPNQTCTIAGGTNGDGSGVLAGADVAITVNCITNQYHVGVTVTGLGAGSVVLQNNGGDNLSIANDGSYTFATALDDLSPYAVTVLSNPTAPNQICSVTGGDNGDGTGALSGADELTIVVTCNTEPTVVNDSYTMNEDGNLIANDLGGTIGTANDDGVFVNDSDIDGDNLQVLAPGNYIAGGIGGNITINADGSFTYQPPADQFGEATFAFNVSDGLFSVSSSLSIDVISVNDPPSFVDAGMVTFQNGGRGTTEVAHWASMISAGPSNETSSNLAFTTTVFDDSDGVLTAGSAPSVDVDGNLHLDLSSGGGTATLEVTLNDGEDDSATVQFDVEVVKAADLIIQIDNGLDLLPGGNNVNYIVTVRNEGPADVSGALVTAEVPQGLVLNSWTCSGTGLCSHANGSMDIINESVDLDFGAELVFLIDVSVQQEPEISVDYPVSILTPGDTLENAPANNNATISHVIGLFSDDFEG